MGTSIWFRSGCSSVHEFGDLSITQIDQHLRHSLAHVFGKMFLSRLRLARFRGTADNSSQKLLSGLCVRCNGGIPSGPESPIPDGHDKNRRLQ